MPVSDADEDIALISKQIEALSEVIDGLCKKAKTIVNGRIVTVHGQTFIADRAAVMGGRLWIEGYLITKRGMPHPRNRERAHGGRLTSRAP